MRRKVHYVVKSEFLWGSIAKMARIQNGGIAAYPAKRLQIYREQLVRKHLSGVVLGEQSGFGVRDSPRRFANQWMGILNEVNPAKKLHFDAVVATPPFSYCWELGEVMGQDFRFKDYGAAPKSAADFEFCYTNSSRNGFCRHYLRLGFLGNHIQTAALLTLYGYPFYPLENPGVQIKNPY